LTTKQKDPKDEREKKKRRRNICWILFRREPLFFSLFFFFFVASLQGKIKRKRAKRKICNQNNSKEARPEKHDYNNNK
jgi:uncharacterized membrane protein